MIPTQDDALKKAKRMLAEFLQVESHDIQEKDAVQIPIRQSEIKPDMVLLFGDVVIIVEYKESGRAASVESGIQQLKRMFHPGKISTRLLVVPYMHNLGKERCRLEGISWLDLSGNADISGPGIRIAISGRPNIYRLPGRSSGVFARKSSRVSRVLLYHSESAFTQRDISKMTDLDEGYVSKIVRSLENDKLIDRLENGSVMVRDKFLLLDAWREVYDFHKQPLIRGHIPARSGLDLLSTTSRTLSSSGLKHAASGLAGAWLYTQFADFRIVTIYLRRAIPADVLSELNFREGELGENIWLVKPKDDWVFYESREIDGIPCAHMVQVYLDLKGHPERSEEAADELRNVIFGLEHL
jgi:hypothetical protein